MFVGCVLPQAETTSDQPGEKNRKTQDIGRVRAMTVTVPHDIIGVQTRFSLFFSTLR
jgi:hypothetical protein